MQKKLRNILLICGLLLAALDGVLILFDVDFSPRIPLSEETSVHFIDVGQGDATLILSGGEAVLIDAGTPESADTIIEYLKSLGVEKLHTIIATHPHADHIGGMSKVLESFSAEYFIMGKEIANIAVFSNMLTALENQHITPTIPEIGDKITLASGASLTFLGPADDVSASNVNNRSIITLFTAGEQSLLIMGDAEKTAEKSLLEDFPLLRCDILKIGHHGSSSSSGADFLKTTNPNTVIISCGKNNDYGHPSPQTLETLENLGIDDVRITAEIGTIVVPFDFESIEKENAA